MKPPGWALRKHSRTLELHDCNGVLIASNDNWKDTQQAEIKATTIPPTNEFESAIVQNLPPGNYTAVLRGKDNTTGVALVELSSRTHRPQRAHWEGAPAESGGALESARLQS